MGSIAILGANGQVGAETIAYLACVARQNVTGFVRSEYSAALLRLLNISYKVADFSRKSDVSDLLRNFDIVVDCTFPGGSSDEIGRNITTSVSNVLGSMHPNSTYVHMSSIMAYGMASRSPWVSKKLLPRTQYAYFKRLGERIARREGRHNNIRVVVLRLGQVHGIFQTVSLEFRTDLSATEYVVYGEPTAPTNTVFANSISQVVLRCAEGQVSPGLYTLVSNPQWTLAELYEYYKYEYELPAKIKFSEQNNAPGIAPRIKGSLINAVLSHREVLETYGLLIAPFLFTGAKGKYRQRQVAQDIAAINAPKLVQQHLLGIAPGLLISEINSSPDQVIEAEKALKTCVEAALQCAGSARSNV